MKLGIVGSEAAKFTPVTETLAREIIKQQIEGIDIVVSGGCHLGGIDIWAAQEAEAAGIQVLEFLPKKLQWEGGYKQRNLQIAKNSDKVICITVKELPSSYKGMVFPFCYHCETDTHIKSGGCWTVKQAIKMGKIGEIIVI